MGSKALLFQRLPGEFRCAPVGTSTALVRKPARIYWVEVKTLTDLLSRLLNLNPVKRVICKHTWNNPYLQAWQNAMDEPVCPARFWFRGDNSIEGMKVMEVHSFWAEVRAHVRAIG